MININTKTTGFGSPAETYVNRRLDLNDLIPIDMISTFYFRYSGESREGVNPNDILVVDRSIVPNINDLVITKSDKLVLGKWDGDSSIWGVVTWVLSQKKNL